jgi:O-antigen/teichoic acid export membrane protein
MSQPDPTKGKTLLANSSWGVISNVLQNVLLMLFFVILTDRYGVGEFSSYVIANGVYQFIVAFSSLGLGQWFTREMLHANNQEALIAKFFKIQIYIGLIFAIINIIFSFALYTDPVVRAVSIWLAVNIIFDNIIYVIKCINVAQHAQKKTFIILIVEAALKLALGCILFVYPFSIIALSILLIAIRFVTLNIFLKVGSSNTIDLRLLLKTHITLSEVREMIFPNWAFIVIGSIAIVYWRIGNIIISKTLAAVDVANYEIAFKIFSIAQILPVIVSSTVFPMLVKAYSENTEKLKQLYKQVYVGYWLFSLMAFTFIFSFSDVLVPLAFGTRYATAAISTKEMFLTIVVFPTVLLQANVLVAMKMERLDMWFNLASLCVYLILCFIGFLYISSLSAVTLSIFFSFVVFHIMQDIVLIRKKITGIGHALTFYFVTAAGLWLYYMLSDKINPYALFTGVWVIVGTICLVSYQKLFGSYKAPAFVEENKL